MGIREKINQRLAGIGAAVSPPPPLPKLAAPPAAELARGEIVVTSIGKVDGEIVSALAAHLEKTFRFKARVEAGLDVPRAAYDREHNQYDPDIFETEVWRRHGSGSPHVVALTGEDLKHPKGRSRYVWSWGRAAAGAQVVSLYRLKTPDRKRFLYRTLVAAQKRMAHTFGIPSCDDEHNFAFSPARSPENLDKMFLALTREQEEQAEFARRYETELLPPVSAAALARLEKESSSGGWIPSVLYAWAVSFSGAGPPKLAEKLLRRAVSVQHAAGFARLGLAILLDEAGLASRAVGELEKAKNANHTVGGIFYHIAWAAIMRGDFARAAILLDREFFVNGIYPRAAQLKKAHREHGEIHRLLNEYRDPLAAEISRHPRLFNLPLALANNAELRKEYEPAAALLKNILDGNPDFSKGRRHEAAAHNLLAWIYADKMRKNLDEALAHAKTAVSLKPESASYLDTLGWTYYRKGEYEKALPLLRKAAALDDNDEEIKEHLRKAVTPAFPDLIK